MQSESEYELKTVKVSEKCQITIPSDIQRKTGIKKGDKLFIFLRENKILLEKEDKFVSQINDDFKDMKASAEYSLKKFWQNELDGIWEQYLK